MNHNYFIYITTNKNKTVLYTGVTNNLKRSILEHWKSVEEMIVLHHVIMFIIYFIMNTISTLIRQLEEKRKLKPRRRDKKMKLIQKFNPSLDF